MRNSGVAWRGKSGWWHHFISVAQKPSEMTFGLNAMREMPCEELAEEWYPGSRHCLCKGLEGVVGLAYIWNSEKAGYHGEMNKGQVVPVCLDSAGSCGLWNTSASHWSGFQKDSSRRYSFLVLVFPPSCCLEHSGEGCTPAAILWHGGNSENKSHGLRRMEQKERQSPRPWWFGDAVLALNHLTSDLFYETGNYLLVCLYDSYLRIWLYAGDSIHKWKRLFKAFPILARITNPIFLLWKFSRSNISAVTLSLCPCVTPPAPHPHHSISLNELEYLVFPKVCEQEHTSQNNGAKSVSHPSLLSSISTLQCIQWVLNKYSLIK